MTLNAGSDIHARRLYVGGVPQTVPESHVVQFLIQTLRKAGGEIWDKPSESSSSGDSANNLHT